MRNVFQEALEEYYSKQFKGSGDYTKGRFAEATELIHSSSRMIAAAPIKQANNIDAHKVKWLSPSGKNIEKLFLIGIQEIHLNIDQLMLMGQCDPVSFIRSESHEYIRSLVIGTNKSLFYSAGRKNGPEGLADIYNDMANEFLAPQIIDAGGVEEDGLTSIYLISWDENGVFLVYPRWGEAYKVEPFRSDIITDKNGGAYRGLSIIFQMRLAIVVENPSNVVRIANIPTNKKLDELNIVELLYEAWLKMENKGVLGNKIFYVNKIIYSKLLDEKNKKIECVGIGNIVFKPHEGAMYPISLNRISANEKRVVEK
jgi:hypothetical protein